MQFDVFHSIVSDVTQRSALQPSYFFPRLPP